MSSFYTTFAATAEDDYRRQRAARDFRSTGGVHTHHASRLGQWRDRRRSARRTAA